MAMIDHAREYLALGFHPIPIEANGKRPLVPWKKYQTEAPTIEEIQKWWPNDSASNIGLVLGRGKFAVDLDGEGAGQLLKDKGINLPVNAPLSKTGNGFHSILASDTDMPDCVGLLSTNGGKPQVDIRGVGYIVVPPSLHPNGKIYEWLIPLDKKIPRAPQSLIDLIKANKTSANDSPLNGPGWPCKALLGVGQGQRDQTAARLAGYLLSKQLDSDFVKIVMTELFAKRCDPPLTQAEIIKTVDSISRREGVTGNTERLLLPKHINDVGHILYESIGDKKKSVSTSFGELDRFLTGGFYPGDLIYLGARPGVGKTALSLQIAVSAAQSGNGVLFVSREMTNQALLRRMIAQNGKIHAARLKHMTDAVSLERVSEILERLGKLPIWFTDEAVSIQDITGMIENFIASNKLGLIIVDHLQLIRSTGAMKDKRLQVEAASQGLKTLALQYKIPILCMSTLSRASDKKNLRPTLDSLRESGELEHDADTVLLMHREFKSPDVELIVAKNRDGHTGQCKMTFEAHYLLFTAIVENADQHLPYADE